jgi:Ni/Fe-hydrogenase subunit HybB-like protein
VGRFITVIGIPSAFLLHGYVGFIVGSIKANPWWGTVLMSIIFIFSAVISGVALMRFVYQIAAKLCQGAFDMNCLHAINKCLFFALVLDAAIESLDWIHRLYGAEESIDVLALLASGKLFYSFLLVQVFLGTVVPLILLGVAVVFGSKLTDGVRRAIGFISSVLILVGVFTMRWNVVIGGQPFSKNLIGFTYKLGLIGSEGLLAAVALLILPFVILSALVFFFKPWSNDEKRYA